MKPDKIVVLYDKDGKPLGTYEEHYYRVDEEPEYIGFLIRCVRLLIDEKRYSFWEDV